MGIKRIVQGNNSKIVRPIGRLFSTPVLLLLSSTLFTLPVLANDDQNTSSNSPWYVGTAIGSSTSDLTQNEQGEQKSAAGVTVNTVNIDDSRVGWKLNVGFDVTRNLAIEAGYMDINETSIEHDSVVSDPAIFASNDKKTHLGTADGFTLGSVYRYDITDDIGLTGSVGVFNWEGEAENFNDQQPLGQDGSSGTDIYFGLGGGYQLTDDVSLSIEWEHYKLDNEGTDMWSIGVNYHFK